MIVADTSALISLTIADSFSIVLDEYDIHTTQMVVDELENTAAYDDSHGRAADDVLRQIGRVTIHEVSDLPLSSTRIDEGEASCLALTDESEATFLLTDDLRALPELQAATDTQVAISPIVLKALVTRDVITTAEATERLDQLAVTRDWLGAPIYRRARQLFDDGVLVLWQA